MNFAVALKTVNTAGTSAAECAEAVVSFLKTYSGSWSDKISKRTAPRDALIADSVNIKSRGIAIGWHRGMDKLGTAVSPLLTLSPISSTSANLRIL